MAFSGSPVGHDVYDAQSSGACSLLPAISTATSVLLHVLGAAVVSVALSQAGLAQGTNGGAFCRGWGDKSEER